jgi:hypothetical protein
MIKIVERKQSDLADNELSESFDVTILNFYGIVLVYGSGNSSSTFVRILRERALFESLLYVPRKAKGDLFYL